MDKEKFLIDDFIENINSIHSIAKENNKPIGLTTKQYEELKNELGNWIPESEKHRLIENLIGQQVFLID